jgi:hypothetical protein
MLIKYFYHNLWSRIQHKSILYFIIFFFFSIESWLASDHPDHDELITCDLLYSKEYFDQNQNIDSNRHLKLYQWRIFEINWSKYLNLSNLCESCQGKKLGDFNTTFSLFSHTTLCPDVRLFTKLRLFRKRQPYRN